MLRTAQLAGIGAIALLSACGASTPSTTSGSGAKAEPSPAAAATKRTLGSVTFNDRGTTNATGKTELPVSLDDFSFSPSFIQGQPGQKLTLRVSNTSSTKHNVSLKAQNVDKDVDARATATVEVTIPQSGALLLFCEFHAARGMNAELLAGTIDPQPITSSDGPSGTPKAGGGAGEYNY